MTEDLARRPIDRFIDNDELTPSFLTGYLDLAVAGTLEYQTFSDLHLEARFAAPQGNLPRGARGFFRSVVRRSRHRVNERIGEIAVVVSDEIEGDLLLENPRAGPPATGLLRAERTVLRHGCPGMVIWSLPENASHSELLRSFVREVSERFLRQLD